VRWQVVVLDDDAESCRALCELLTAEGFHALPFTSGDTAWSAIESRQIRPDVVVSDIRMPGLDGVAFLRRLQVGFPGIPVILVSAFPDDRTWSEALRLGALDIVPKPIRAGVLVRLLRDVARGGQNGSATAQTH
jgi:two-component system, NtrC family, C4-dicarboxylate transport response regulator DctD